MQPEVIDLIQSYGVIISAGHTNATFEEANEGFSKVFPLLLIYTTP
jgi:N-acetylglucosamine-6-phosphate deacetylase